MKVYLNTVYFLTVEEESLVDSRPCCALGHGEAAVPQLLVLLMKESGSLIAFAALEVYRAPSIDGEILTGRMAIVGVHLRQLVVACLMSALAVG